MIQDIATAERAVSSQTPRWRIAVIAAVVLLAVAIGAVLGVTLSGRASAGLSAAAGYAPADTAMYLEANLELPDAQRANLRGLIQRFPGVDADQVLGSALADTLDEALSGAPFDYSTDIAPWFDGQVAIAVLDLPATTDPLNPQIPATVAFFGTRDAAAATAVADRVRGAVGDQGGSFSSSRVDGVTVWTMDLAEPMTGADFSYAVTDDQLLLGSSPDAVTAALDVHAGSADSLAQRPEVRDLSGHLPDGATGLMTMDLSSAVADLRDALASQMPALGDAYDQLLADSPTFMMGALTFEADAVRMDTVSTAPGGDQAVSNGARDLADQVPADALFYADGRNVGTRMSAVVTSLQAALAGSGMDPAMLDQVEGALGASLEDYVSWIGDAAVVAGYDGSQPYLGMVLEATDANAAATRVNQLSALAQLAGLDPSSGVTVRTDTVAGSEVTTLSVEFSGAPAFGVPGSDAGFAVQWAVDGDRVLIGVGDRFVERILQLDQADSLGASDRFATATGRYSGENASTMFLDVAAVRNALASSAALAEPMASVLSAFDYVLADGRVEGSVVVDRVAVVLK